MEPDKFSFAGEEDGTVTIKFGANLREDAFEVMRFLTVKYEQHNERPENKDNLVSPDTIRAMWRFAIYLEGTEVADNEP